ncbi:MAG TPA: thioredoxin family protein [Tepidisphaeraceae bacterium]|nr:thioredoxin family protein [Tepidisphaeraceae bacterium]
MLTPEYLSQHFSTALPYAQYVLSGTDEQRRRWSQVHDLTELSAPQKQLVSGFARDMKVLVISGIWCGDCVQQCPLLERIAQANASRIELRFADRDTHRELTDQLHINGGDRVPVAIFMAEDFQFCQSFGDRTLSRYRAMALKQLGASCPIGIAPPDRDELIQTLADWLAEFERIQLMLRLSARLRQKHGD